MQQNQTGKTKTAMLLELESIKDLLVEEDGIPILQEVVLQVAPPVIALVQEPQPTEIQDSASLNQSGDEATQQDSIDTNAVDDKETDREENNHSAINPPSSFVPEIIASPTEISSQAPESKALYREEQQQDFFPLTIVEELTSPATQPEDKSTKANASHPSQTNTIANSQRPTPAKASGQNPFLPEHIRARLQGNNPAQEKPARNNPPTALSASSGLLKKASGQQQLIDDMVDKLLPTLEKELRQRLEGMSKRMLEDLLDEKK